MRHRDHGAIVASEEALIGSLLLAPHKIDQLIGLNAQSFFDDELGKLFEVIRDRHQQCLPNDIVLLTPIADQIGISRARLATLFTNVPHASHARFYGDNVAEASALRKLSEIATSFIRSIDDATKPSDAILNELEAAIESMRKSSQTNVISLADAGRELVKEIESSRKNHPTVCWGLSAIDQSFGGMRPGEMFVLAARPGNGKTALGLQTAVANSRLGRGVLFVSLEMTAGELAGRYFSSDANIDSRDVREGKITDRQVASINGSIHRVDDFPLMIWAPSQATIGDIRGIARAQDELNLLVIDYLSLVSHRDSRRDQYQQVADNSRAIKRLAKELSIPVLCLQQLNRDADGHRPKLSNLRDSGSIEQDADCVAFLHPADDQGEVEFIVEKNRHGSKGGLKLKFDGARTRFSDNKFSGFENYS
jgi:replicative DNA helicase